MDVFSTNFATIDWVIVMVYICIPVVIGVIVRKYVRQLSDFIVAGRSLRLFVAIATLTGTELGLVTVMYNAELGFKHGFSAFHVGIIETVCILAIGLTGFIVYKLRELRVMTIPEFYEMKFGRNVRIIGGFLLATGGILNMGLFLQAGARFMMGVTGYSNPAGLKLFMSVMLIMVLVYTVMGGMVSVVLNDFLQFIVLSIGMLVGSYFAITKIGWGNLFRAPETVNQASWFNPVAEGSGFGSIYVIFMVVLTFSAGALWQSGTLRALAAKSPKVAKQLFAWSSVSYLARRVIPMLWGICAFVFISQTPKLLSAFQGPDAINSQFGMPIFLAKILPSGFLGLIAAGMFAAFMSTHDSYLLSWSSVITQDIVAPLKKGELSDKSRMLITRISIVSIGMFLLIWGLWFEAPVSLWNYMAVTGTIYLAGAFTVVTAGLYWKKASKTGATIALFAGLLAILGIGPWTQGDNVPFYLSDKFIGLITFAIAILGMIIGSLLFPDKHKQAEVSQ
ncbi:MAG: sodium:solute symporter family protein [Candidatus Aminicenantes bacterium]|nr:sodium:solute symporter family protein [Candidatus Aminicenantes bacterium]MDH5704707.1 sodium:solute symporter family protein [Candidatus Aminicenantes bacterium]